MMQPDASYEDPASTRCLGIRVESQASAVTDDRIATQRAQPAVDRVQVVAHDESSWAAVTAFFGTRVGRDHGLRDASTFGFR